MAAAAAAAAVCMFSFAVPTVSLLVDFPFLFHAVRCLWFLSLAIEIIIVQEEGMPYFEIGVELHPRFRGQITCN